jgi:hypothetical protein
MPKHYKTIAKKKKGSVAAKARKDHKKVDSRFKDGVRKNGKMKIKSGPNSPKGKKKGLFGRKKKK